MSNGFMVPGSRSGSYVASKRTEEGSFAYDTARQGLGIQKQAALQELGKEYETTIENAYTSYLANQRTIGTSAMGQGYKEAYMQAQDEALRAQTAEANLTAASARAELESQIGQAQEAVTEQYKTEVGYLDRALQSMDNYLTYLSSLSKDNKNYWNLPEEELSKLKTEDMYEQLLSAQPQDYTYYNETTGESAAGLPYLEWLDTQLGTSKADTEWREWLYGGGYNDIRKAYESQKSTGQLTQESKARNYIKRQLDVNKPDTSTKSIYTLKDIPDTKENKLAIANELNINANEIKDGAVLTSKNGKTYIVSIANNNITIYDNEDLKALDKFKNKLIESSVAEKGLYGRM